MAYFFCRLIPPRTSFPGDMTAEEGAAMSRHADYLRGEIAAGRALLAGPVMDPAGAFGLLVVEVADRAAATALTAADPVVRAGLGFAYEIQPMASLLRPEGR